MKGARSPKEASALDQRHNDTSPLVLLDHGEVFTTSLLIAEKFGKRHADVLRAVENLDCSTEFTERNFALSEYTDPTGRTLPMYRINRDGFIFVVTSFTGRAAAAWKEKFIGAFNAMEIELRRIAISHASPDWSEARQIGKQDRRELTDAVQALCDRAHERGDSTTPLHLWEIAATKTATNALFDTNGQRITAIRDRLTARQLRRLSMAEQVYADAVLGCLDSDLHHQAISEEAKIRVQAFAAATGGREAPGVDRRPPRIRGFIEPELASWMALAVMALLLRT